MVLQVSSVGDHFTRQMEKGCILLLMGFAPGTLDHEQLRRWGFQGGGLTRLMWDSPLYSVDKKAGLAYGRVDYSKAGNLSRGGGGKKVESGRGHVAPKEKDTGTLLVGHSLVVIHN